ncbi:hypothetical protein N9K52_00510 [Litoricolaceae bacterium]|nr:hypothetical protein [Litorivicinaceae bacterium]
MATIELEELRDYTSIFIDRSLLWFTVDAIGSGKKLLAPARGRPCNGPGRAMVLGHQRLGRHILKISKLERSIDT